MKQRMYEVALVKLDSVGNYEETLCSWYYDTLEEAEQVYNSLCQGDENVELNEVTIE